MKDLKKKENEEKKWSKISIKSNISQLKTKPKKKQRITLSSKKGARKKIHTPNDHFGAGNSKLRNEYSNEYERPPHRPSGMRGSSLEPLPLRKSYSSTDTGAAQVVSQPSSNMKKPNSDCPSVFIPMRVQNVIRLKPTKSSVKLPNITINTSLKSALKML
uniref:Uncharacterized protein n=1 Tax=Euplotes crassus TaxID=5936 RepID=A0A7S3KBE6_EUPCR|mmetsp:Transcript_15538/g.15370  ORF Transcript_15538/g.15370 Transcript_15538/m.15370 type:complete len:160 (+) Transcript_15538:253-732(+)